MKNTLHLNLGPVLQRAAKARAALLGTTVSEYIGFLVTNDCRQEGLLALATEECSKTEKPKE